MKITINDTKFLDKETEIKHKDIITLASEGSWEISKKFTKDDGTPSKQFEINVTLANGEERGTILSWANVKLLVQGFGDETASWVGKQVRAWKTKSEKAKLGYTYLYVPIDWERDDTGEWVIPTGSQEKSNKEWGIPTNDDFEATFGSSVDDIPL